MMELLKSLIKNFEEVTGIKFDGQLKINGRLTKVLGKCQAMVTTENSTGRVIKVKPMGIDISKKFLDVATPEEVVDVLAHEFAHYCTYKKVGLHDHRTSEFKMFCKMLDTTHAPSMSTQNKIKNKYDIYCSCCNKHLQGVTTARAGVVKNPQHYKSACCKSEIKVVQNY